MEEEEEEQREGLGASAKSVKSLSLSPSPFLSVSTLNEGRTTKKIEEEEEEAILAWFRLAKLLFLSLSQPSEWWARNLSFSRPTREGRKPFLFHPIPSYTILYVEV